jgi:urease beta subunit
LIPGEYLLGDGDIVANAGRRTVELTVANTGDRPIQIGSHFHFFEANRADRDAALRRLAAWERPA